VNRPLFTRSALLALLVLAGCSAPVRQAPKTPDGATAPGSAPGPVYGAPSGGGYGWSAQMEAVESDLVWSLRGTGANLSKTTDGRLWVTLPGDMAFETNRSALKPAARVALDKVASALTKQPTADLRIVGHTDAKGQAAANDLLSLDRAASTRDWLVARGMSPTRISVAGRGGRDPLASNDDESGRATNRRVEILISERAKGKTGP
jgi:outer membrane protein OmpA-like peptidoglycan-associated protein